MLTHLQFSDLCRLGPKGSGASWGCLLPGTPGSLSGAVLSVTGVMVLPSLGVELLTGTSISKILEPRMVLVLMLAFPATRWVQALSWAWGQALPLS